MVGEVQGSGVGWKEGRARRGGKDFKLNTSSH